MKIIIFIISSILCSITILFANNEKTEKNTNEELKEELEWIWVKDQTLRSLYQDAEKKFGEDSKNMDYFWSLMAEQDEKNVKRVIEIIEKHDWPGISEVGERANSAVWIVIQHAELVIQEKYLPLLQKSVEEEESSPEDLAYLEDRILLRNHKKQIYGTQVRYDSQTGEPFVWPAQNPEKINNLRTKIGMNTIEEYARSRGVSNYTSDNSDIIEKLIKEGLLED